MQGLVLSLYNQNYANEGMCLGLEKSVKTIEKEFKKSGITKHIKYLPWAIVEKLFRMQGGKIEVLNWRYEVEFPFRDYNGETGEIVAGTRGAYFVHLKGTWNGEELEEFYPIFDNQTSKVVRTPDAQQLNASRQRGSVRLIARLAGIGLWIFEQHDDLDEEENKDGEIKVVKKAEEVATNPTLKPTKTNTQQAKKVIVKEEQKEEVKVEVKNNKVVAKQEKDNAMANILGIEEIEEEVLEEVSEQNVMDIFSGNIIKSEIVKEEVKKIVEPKVTQKQDFSQGTEQHSDLLVQVKGFVKTHKDVILAFRNAKGKELLGDLSFEELSELLVELKK